MLLELNTSLAQQLMPHNIVFPTYMKKEKKDYCVVLNEVLKLTKPVLINDFANLEEAESHINNLKEYKRAM